MKIKAKVILKENKRAFIKDTHNTYFFCDILIIGEDRVLFYPFKGNGEGEKVERFWADILDLQEYKERVVEE